MPDVAARFHPDQRRDGDGMWTDDGVPNGRGGSRPPDTGGTARTDRLGLGERIELDDGEQLVMSDRLRSSTGYNNVQYAVTSGRGGSELRLSAAGTPDSEWSAADEWTGHLEAGQVAELRTAIADAAAQATEAANNGDGSDDALASGTVGDEFGSVHWSTWLNDEASGWELSLTASSTATADDTADGAKLTPAQVKRLLDILKGVEGMLSDPPVGAAAAPALGRIPNVELARTGSWPLSTGEWNPKPQDFAAAVAALNCAAIKQPRIRLGHVDPRFDGEPAVGRVDNLRIEAGGHSLVGDLVGVPSWLPQVVAAAYPDRSVEGMYDFTCQIGHRHPFVLTGLALLGVTAPGVGTLRSIEDVGAMYGVTTAQPVAAGRPVSATFTAAAGKDDNELKRYWVHGDGAKRWVSDQHPWSKLVKLLTEHVGRERAKRIASSFFHARFGYWPGHRKGANKTGPG